MNNRNYSGLKNVREKFSLQKKLDYLNALFDHRAHVFICDALRFPHITRVVPSNDFVGNNTC